MMEVIDPYVTDSICPVVGNLTVSDRSGGRDVLGFIKIVVDGRFPKLIIGVSNRVVVKF